IVGETLNLSGHGVEASAGIGLHVLNGFLEGPHGGGDFVDVVVGLLNERLGDSMVLGDLCGHVFLTLEQGSDVTLKLDELARDSFGGARTDQAPAQGSREDGGAENGNVTKSHGYSS